MKEALNCSECEYGMPNEAMCGVVARRAVAEMAKIGYDTSSDERPYSAIVDQTSVFDARVAQIAEQECNLRLLQRESLARGYGTVTY